MKYCVFLLLFVVFGCGREISAEDLKNLNGYWEIESAKLADGSHREYKVSETVDFIELNGDSGVRKKLMAQLDGKFVDTGNPQEHFTIENKDGKTLLHYTTDYSKWTEELLEVEADHLKVKNADGLTFEYKRYKPLNLDEAHK